MMSYFVELLSQLVDKIDFFITINRLQNLVNGSCSSFTFCCTDLFITRLLQLKAYGPVFNNSKPLLIVESYNTRKIMVKEAVVDGVNQAFPQRLSSHFKKVWKK